MYVYLSYRNAIAYIPYTVELSYEDTKLNIVRSLWSKEAAMGGGGAAPSFYVL
jgi:hypothetical protein